MAVYTDIDKEELDNLLSNYDLGELIDYKGIVEGVENSNFKIITTSNTFILTIFEKRVSKEDLPFFIKLMEHLNNKNLKCPKPIKDKQNNYIRSIKGKSCVIVSFIPGNWVKKITNLHCEQLGLQLAHLHIATKDFDLTRPNTVGINNWKNIFEAFKNEKKDEYASIYKVIEEELEFLNKEWPKNLSSGVIHADLFQDNVFFKNDVFSGFIDFYFSCVDFYAYELAVCLNAWCFENDSSFNTTKARMILNTYEKKNPLTANEKKFFPILSRGAALRFLLTRLNDIIFTPENAMVSPKDPNEYLKILNFHRGIKSINEYGLKE